MNQSDWKIHRYLQLEKCRTSAQIICKILQVIVQQVNNVQTQTGSPRTTLQSVPSRLRTHVLVTFDLFSMYCFRLFPLISKVYSYAKPLTASMLIVALVSDLPTLNVSFPTSLNIQSRLRISCKMAWKQESETAAYNTVFYLFFVFFSLQFLFKFIFSDKQTILNMGYIHSTQLEDPKALCRK